jgi:hypothetical protein
MGAGVALAGSRGASEVAGAKTGTGLEQALRATLTMALDVGDDETATGLVALMKARAC